MIGSRLKLLIPCLRTQMSDKEMKEFVVRSIAALPLPALLDDHPRERAAVQLLLGQQHAASDTLMLGLATAHRIKCHTHINETDR